MNGPGLGVPAPIGETGALRWPGRERLSARDRVLLESRSYLEFVLGAAECGDEAETELGCFACLWLESVWLRDGAVQRRVPRPASPHGADGAPLDCWRALCN